MNATINYRPPSCSRVSASIPMRLLLSCALVIATTGLGTADVRLKGNVGAKIIYDNVIIARGTTCVLNGTTINGSIRVHSGAKLYAKRARVIGNVEAEESMLVVLMDSTQVTGDVLCEGTRSIVVRDGTQVGGNVQLREGTASSGVDALHISNSSVNGNVLADKCRGRLRVISCLMGGNVQLKRNRRGRYEVHNNEVWKDIQFYGNSGNGAILDNSVSGNLLSKENTPRPTVKNNEVRGDVDLK